MHNNKEIIVNLEKVKENHRKAKKKLIEWAADIGFQEELVQSGLDVWNELAKVDNFPDPISASGINLSQVLLKQSNDLIQYVDKSNFGSALASLATTSAASGSIAMSGIALTYPTDHLPQVFVNLDQLTNKFIRQNDITNRLRKINPSLADEYDNAWSTFYSWTSDRTRSPMFLIREVITHLIYHFAPDKNVMLYHSIIERKNIHRRHRIQYISSIIDPSIKQSFINQEQAIIDVYNALSSAHNPKKLDPTKTKGYLYQADALIKLILDSLIKLSI